MSYRFEVILLDEALEFIQSQPLKVRMKILQNLRRTQNVLNPVFLKKLNNEIWEFRTRFAGNQYRLLAFWDKSISAKTLIVCTHGFVKKRRMIDSKEIDKASEIRKVYFDQKEK